MHPYRRNIDERLRKLQREVFGGDINSQALLLAERIRSGFIDLEEVKTAAYFNHPIALLLLDMERVSFEDFYAFLDSADKNLTIRWAYCVASHALSIWHECMIRRSTGSSEERALTAISPGLREIVEAPTTAIAEIQNWLDDEENTDSLEVLYDFLMEISQEMDTIRATGGASQLHLWNPTQAANAAIEAIAKAVCATSIDWNIRIGTYENSRRCNYQAAKCYQNTIKAIRLHTNCTVEEAADELLKTILNSMFPSL